MDARTLLAKFGGSTGFLHRGGFVSVTLAFGTGVATAILPIGLGATALTQLFIEQHTWLFPTGGLPMVAGGVVGLSGRMPPLPMPGPRTATEGS